MSTNGHKLFDSGQVYDLVGYSPTFFKNSVAFVFVAFKASERL